MLLKLDPLFLGEQSTLPIDYAPDLSEVEWNGCRPFQDVKVKGELRKAAGGVMLNAVVTYRYEGTCDRCMCDIRREQTLVMKHMLVVSLNHEENDSFVLLENYQLPLDDLVEEDLILDQPSKVLCSEECRGLCPQCGQDLNVASCDCRRETVDPRLAALQQLLD